MEMQCLNLTKNNPDIF